MCDIRAGDFLEYDFRSEPIEFKDHFRILQWNIERGYKLNNVLSILKNLDADILCLQELDIYCKRSGNCDIAKIIAKELKLKCVFVAEFQEIESDVRNSSTQGGGVHGNAIFSKYNFNFWSISHKYQPFDWNKDGLLKKEPRIGNRNTIAAEIYLKNQSLICYSAHLEVFTGIFGRVMHE